jgi:protein ImuA
MNLSKADIIAQLQKEILPLYGSRTSANSIVFDSGLGRIKHAFPNASFPVSAMHEFICNEVEDNSATSGFISGILSSLMRSNGTSLWISASRSIFPPALKLFGIEPDKIIFVDIHKEKERLWAIEEALKCDGLSAVISELQDMSFTASRRLQLAVEKSGVTGFFIRRNPKNLTTACAARWRITSLPCEVVDGMPGLTFPRWNVELLKVRNGKPGTWQLEWIDGSFRHVYKLLSIGKVPQRKAV